MDFPVLTKKYASTEEFLTELKGVRASGGLLVSSTEQISLRTNIKIVLDLGFVKKRQELWGEIVFTSPRESLHDYGIQLHDPWREALQELEEACKLSAPETPASKDEESIFHQLKDMPMNEKIQLALRGGREERRILLKMASSTLSPYILKNPKVNADEVAQILRMPQTSVDMIMTVTQNRDWMKNPQVRLAIVKNPKSPLKIVQDHINFLADTELYQLAKSEHIREAISNMARKILAKKGKPVQ